MTLRARLLLSSFLLSLVTTLAISFVVRNAWESAESKRFSNDFSKRIELLERRLSGESLHIKARLAPHCLHNPMMDSALVGARSGTLPSRLLSFRAQIPELRAALNLDELVMVSNGGVVLAGGFEQGALSPLSLEKLVTEATRNPNFRQGPSATFVGACVKKEGALWVGLLGATYLEPLLSDANTSDFSLELLHAPNTEKEATPVPRQPHTDLLQQDIRLSVLDGATIRAARSRSPLLSSVRDLNVSVWGAAASAFLVALLIAYFLSRGLASPIMKFAEQTRKVVSGTVHRLPEEGGPELIQAARAFNETLLDLRALKERLVVTEKIAARREIARQIAHEIKNPLSPIRTSIETLQKLRRAKHPDFDTYFEETTSTVLYEVKRIANLASNFAEYARLPSPQPSEIDLASLIYHLVQLHQGLGTAITWEDHGLPTFIADGDQISQVITNLIKNGIEATQGIEEPLVSIVARLKEVNEKEWIEVIVSDNGPGVPASLIDALFEPYATTKEEGSGLGLPISHRIAVEHGGDITYRNNPGGGASFSLTLPRTGPPHLPSWENSP